MTGSPIELSWTAKKGEGQPPDILKFRCICSAANSIRSQPGMVATPQEKVNSILDFSRSEIVSYGVFCGKSEFTLEEL